MTELLISAGDASGDVHGAELIAALRERIPELRAFGLGGRGLARAGVELLVDQETLAVGGLVEALSSVGRAHRALRDLERAARMRAPALAVLIDSPELNLRLARRMKKLGIAVFYYIAPQVWAWRTRRINQLARNVDRLAVIFPFERDVFRAASISVEFVGHPLVDRLREVREAWDRKRAREALGLDPDAPLLLLLPGSRHNEIRTGLKVHLEAARALRRRRPTLRCALALAPTIDAGHVRAAITAAQIDVEVIADQTYIAIVAADVVLAKPGTATVEVAGLSRPLATVGRAHPLTAAVIRRVVKVPSFTMPNLIAGAPVVPEFLQERAIPERVAAALDELLEGPARVRQLEKLAEVARQLGPGGASHRAAAIAEEMIRGAAAT